MTFTTSTASLGVLVEELENLRCHSMFANAAMNHRERHRSLHLVMHILSGTLLDGYKACELFRSAFDLVVSGYLSQSAPSPDRISTAAVKTSQLKCHSSSALIMMCSLQMLSLRVVIEPRRRH